MMNVPDGEYRSDCLNRPILAADVFALLLFGAALLSACTSAAEIASCIPGASAACACTDGRTGAQVCNGDGTFASCSCTSSGQAGFDAGPFQVTTLAGNGTPGFEDGDGGPHGSAQFLDPNGVAIGADGTVYVADFGNSRVRTIDASGTVTTLAGNGTRGFADGTGGPGGSAQFSLPYSVAPDRAGNVYVADSANNRIRKIDLAGNVTTVAGNGTAGDVDGTGGAAGTAEFAAPFGIAVDGSGNLYVADTANNRIRKIDASGNVTTFSGNGSLGGRDGTGGRTGSAQFAQPSGVAVSATGDVFVADTLNHKIRKLDVTGSAITLAGDGDDGYSDGAGGPVGPAQFGVVVGLALDVAGNVYVSDYSHNRLRLIDAAGEVTTVAGNGKPGFADGTGGPEGTAEFWGPTGVAVGPDGRIYLTDNANNRVRLVTPGN
jgi:sugar lactone lactonase YvrE